MTATAKNIAKRTKRINHESELLYRSLTDREFLIYENTELVDGIGGISWDGSFGIVAILEVLDLTTTHIVELGCGSGVCSNVIACETGAKVTATDRFVDLVELNLLASKSADIDVEASRGSVDIIIGAEIACLRKQQDKLMNTINFISSDSTVVLISFDEGPPPNLVSCEKEMDMRMKQFGFRKAIIYTGSISWTQINCKGEEKGAKQTAASSIDCTWDFKNDLDRIMFPRARSSLSSAAAKSSSTTDRRAEEKTEINSDLNSKEGSSNDMTILHPPLPPDYVEMENKVLNRIDLPSRQVEGSAMPAPPLRGFAHINHSEPKHTRCDNLHHIAAYFRPSATSTCSRCHQRFFRLSALNRPVVWEISSAGVAKNRQVVAPGEEYKISTGGPAVAEKLIVGGCRYHSGYYVCRRHPAELRISSNAGGDGLGYYGTGKEGWPAEFWDCCGLEDPLAPGCTLSTHISY